MAAAAVPGCGTSFDCRISGALLGELFDESAGVSKELPRDLEPRFGHESRFKGSVYVFFFSSGATPFLMASTLTSLSHRSVPPAPSPYAKELDISRFSVSLGHESCQIPRRILMWYQQ